MFGAEWTNRSTAFAKKQQKFWLFQSSFCELERGVHAASGSNGAVRSEENRTWQIALKRLKP
ncbi:MAG TPA: hypothetical protein VK327_07275, partial [Candidatus Paceibacterota bacterium]|nr:hypothetical protein [Candidatus Paceibacterota bacterium]